MIKIFYIIIVFLFLISCSTQDSIPVKEIEKYTVLDDSALSLFPIALCDFNREKKHFPATKAEFEAFLSETPTLKALLNRFSNLNYFFLFKKNSNSLLCYEAGIDGDNDSVSTYYSINDTIPTNNDGDLLIFTLMTDKCKYLYKNIAHEPTFYSETEIIEADRSYYKIFLKNIRLKAWELRDTLHDFYIPKSKEEIKKQSLFEVTKRLDKWEINLVEYEHQYEELQFFIPVVRDWLASSSFIKEANIDKAFIPIVYFDKSQLIPLE